MSILALSASASGSVMELRPRLVEPLVLEGWTVAVTLTPTAAAWFDDAGESAALEALTGLPVRSTSRLPREPRPHPDPDVVAVAPATANTVTKLALGIGDNQALTLPCEAIGTPGLPVVVAPGVNTANVSHPAWPGHLAALRAAGVHIVLDDDLHAPRAAAPRPLPWDRVLHTIRSCSR